MANRDIRVLGIDTSLRSTGVGVVAVKGNRFSAVEFGVIKIPSKSLHSECLKRLSIGITDSIQRTTPSAVAIEGAFFCENARTAMILGEARGVVIAACAINGVPVYEYAPRRVKQAVVGSGAASKEQVRRMVMTLLAIKEEMPEDASDALAIAICHLHNRTDYSALQPKEI